MANQVSYRILIKSGTDFYKLGTIGVHRFEGDILYFPTQEAVEHSSVESVRQKKIQHVSWHKSGRVHIKDAEGGIHICEEGLGYRSASNGTRAPIEEIGFQEVLRDTVIDVATLPRHTKSVAELDVVFDLKEYAGAVQFTFSIVSGRLILKAHEGEKSGIKLADKELVIDSQNRALGWESGNGDKLLQYALVKFTGDDLKAGRRLFVPGDSMIRRGEL